MDIFIFRHGETDWNLERRLQGHTDIPLNQNGIEQARSLAELLAPFSPQVILSSDLSRAHETAKIVNRPLNVPMHITSALRECFVGQCEGMLRDEIAKLHGEDIWERWISMHPDDHDFNFPGGESKGQHLKRMTEFVEEFCLKNSHYQRIAVSTHGGSLRRFILNCEGAPQEQGPFPNCVLYKLSFEPTQRVWRFHNLIPATK